MVDKSRRGLQQALKEVKFAEKAQLKQPSQAEPFRVTLFDLIAEKERRQRAHSPPPVPPKPMRRLATISRSTDVTVPKTVEALRPAVLHHSVPPSGLKKVENSPTDGGKPLKVITKLPYVLNFSIVLNILRLCYISRNNCMEISEFSHALWIE